MCISLTMQCVDSQAQLQHNLADFRAGKRTPLLLVHRFVEFDQVAVEYVEDHSEVTVLNEAVLELDDGGGPHELAESHQLVIVACSAGFVTVFHNFQSA
jgi:hypothetical protein